MSNNRPQSHFNTHSNTRSLLLLATALTVAGTGMASAFAATANEPSGKTGKVVAAPEYGADADIGTVTRLALAVTVEEYRKKLRELRQNNAPAGRGNGPALADPLPAAGVPVTAAARAAKLEPQAPQITSISGPTNALNAVLVGGRTLKRGDVVQLASVRWTVQGITPGGVRFERCEGHSCQEQTVSVSGRM